MRRMLRWAVTISAWSGGWPQFCASRKRSITHIGSGDQPRRDISEGCGGRSDNARGDAAEDLRDANRSAELFEKEFHVRMYFDRRRQAACSWRMP